MIPVRENNEVVKISPDLWSCHTKNLGNRHSPIYTMIPSGKHTKSELENDHFFHGKTHYFDLAMASIAMLVITRG